MNARSIAFSLSATAATVVLVYSAASAVLRSPSGTLGEGPRTEAQQQAIDTRTQYDLEADIKAAEPLALDERAYRLSEIRDGWQGRRYRWSVRYLGALCPTPERCNVLAFDHDGADKNVVQGWMPRLTMTARERAKLERQCSSSTSCTITFEGQLERFVLSTEHFTSLHFGDITIVSGS